MLKRLWGILCLLVWCGQATADEGMWMPDRISRQTRSLMQEMGLSLPFDSLCNTRGEPCLQQAVVSFGGFCSGVVVSDHGLVFTNHHCGFNAIRQHSTVEHDYLTHGFVAHSYGEELPNPDLFVSFLLRTEEVTGRVVQAFRPDMSEGERTQAADSVMLAIQNECLEADSLLRYTVTPCFGGQAYYLSVYKDYTDVRLVFAPPASVGKFGWDTDNWMWPRHTGDFAVFRIYAGPDNEPADYHPDNRPFCPPYHAPVSLEGYQEGSFCMTLGYPGHTQRYLSSFGVNERLEADNRAMMDVRQRKQAIWKQAMENDAKTQIQYAAKYATSSNYWKNSIGMNRSVRELHVVERRQSRERELRHWVRQNPDGRRDYLRVLTELELAYRNRFPAVRARAFFGECFLNAPELVKLALAVMNFDTNDLPERVEKSRLDIEQMYADFNPEIDRQVLAAMLETYRNAVPSAYWPEVYRTVENDFGGSTEAYARRLYEQTTLVTPEALHRVADRDSTFSLFDDPAAGLALDLLVTYFDLNQALEQTTATVDRNERLLEEALHAMYAGHDFYPDANATLRLSFGVVKGYSPRNGVHYNWFTTTQGILEKAIEHAGDPDFGLQPELQQLLERKGYGHYANADGEMNVCFISDNDITGGNSGSGMFDGHGRLIGLAFDGNWEGMAGDFLYDPQRQRCIGVDIRYMLYLIETYGHASHLIRELGLPVSLPD